MTQRKTTYETLQQGYTQDLWYDWFCKDSSLERRGKKLIMKLKQISMSPRFDITKTYVFFKNNCPMSGTVYDDFRICDINGEGVIYTITPKSGFTHLKNKAEVWGRENNFKEALVSGTWNDVLAFFATKPDQKVTQ